MNQTIRREPARRTSGLLDDANGIRHGFFGRAGGVSSGPFASLNCGPGSGDDADRVRENRARVAAALGAAPDRLVSAFQVHGSDVRTVEAPWATDDRPRVDGMVTDRPGLALGILTADCAPVLLADPEAGIIGAAHAGWRGALAGIVEATIAAMTGLGADRARIRAAIGPCIGGAVYEVGPDFPDPFLAREPADARFFRPAARNGHFLFDLPGYVSMRLRTAGVTAVDPVAGETLGEEAVWFSYRRTTLAGDDDYGRNLSAVMLGD